MNKSLLFQSKFYILFLLTLLFSVAPPSLFAAQDEEEKKPILLFKQGEIQIIGENGSQPLGEGSLSSTDKIRIGDVDLISLQGPTAEQVAAEAAVIGYGEKQVVTLVAGSSLLREQKEGTTIYQIEGALHLFLTTENRDQSADFSINQIPFQSQRVHLFYNGYSDPPTMDVLEGHLAFDLPDGSLQVNSGERIIWNMDSFEVLKGEQPLKEGLIEVATIPGFGALGIFQLVGKAEFEGGKLEIQRFGVTSQIKESPASLFKGDIIKTSSGQSVRLKLKTEDVINLSANATFEIQEFSPKKEGGKLLFKFSGKIRSKIKTRKGQRRSIRFRTAAAIIGVRGTEFEATGGEFVAEILTIEGIVGVGDSEGNGEVEVTAGMMTTVEAGKPPQEPTKIPEDRLKELQEEAPLASTGSNSESELLNQTFDVPSEKPLILNWSKAIQSIEITIGDVKVPSTLGEDKKTVEIDSQLLLEHGGENNKVTLSMKITSEGEQESTIQKEFTLPKSSQETIQTPPEIKLTKAFSLEPMQQIESFNLQADRGIALWHVQLDDSKISLTPPGEGEEKERSELKSSSNLVLKGELFGELSEGLHKIWIQGTDEFGLVGEIRLEIEIDRTGPVLSKKIQLGDSEEKIDLKDMEIETERLPVFQWNEVLRSASIKIQDTTLSLTLSEDRKEGRPENDHLYQLLSKTGKTSIEIISIDLAGNESVAIGNISLKQEVESTVVEKPLPVTSQKSSVTMKAIPQVPSLKKSPIPLWKTYKDSILKQSKSPLDQRMLAERPRFRSSKIKKLNFFDEQRIHKKLHFKENPHSKLIEKMGRKPLY